MPKSKTPTDRLLLRGSWRGKVRSKTEPKFKLLPLEIEAPSYFNESAKVEYLALANELRPILRTTDLPALQRLIIYRTLWLKALSEANDSDRSRRLCLYGSQLDHLEKQFGLTPSSRANIQAETPISSENDRFFRISR